MDRVVIFMLVLVLGVSLLAAGAANATVYYVDAGRPDDTGAGTAWATAKKTIQAGINAGAGTDEVWVKAGTYVERITLRSSCCLYGGFAGTETLRTQRNWTTNVTIIDGSAGGSVVTMNTITNATLDGFTVQNGSATSGAGIYCATVSNTNTIANCRITGNTIPSGNGNGAGVYCTGGTFIHCTVSNNSIPYVASAISQGGGVYCTGGAFTDCTISGNANKGTRGGSGGGGIYCTGGTFTNCTISGNTCTSPGVYGAYGTGVGIYCTGGTFTNCTVCANVASGTSGLYCGGGVYCAGGAFMNCAVCGNSIGSQTTQGRGGGFYYSSGSITSCIVSGNTATAPILSARAQGGGVYCESRWPTLLTNCIVSGNVVNDEGGVTEGGGMYKGTAINCIISSNTAVGAERDGGGVWSTSSSQFKNCIFHGNTSRAIHGVSDPVVTNCLFYGNPDSDYYQNGTLLTGAAAINALAGNSGNVDGDPLFVMDGPAAITGTWTAAPIYNATTWQTTLTNAGASYTPNAFAGRLINTDTSQLSQAYIVSNTATEIVVWGDVTAYAASGDSYKLIDYHLRYGSGAADLGIGGSGVPTTDIEGNPRPVDVPGIGANGTGTEYDIGANEEQGPFPPSPPTNPGAISIGLNTITWTWQDNSSNETGFKVYDDPGAGPPTTLQFTTAANAQSWQHSGLNVNAQYAFQVAATIAAGDSAKTTNYIVWTLIEAVTGLTFSGVTTTGITVASTNTPSNLTSGTSGLYYANTTAGTNSGWVQSMTPWASSSLTPNTQYAFSSQSRNGASITTTAATGSKYTLASAPAIGNNVACDKTVSTLYPASTTFTFSNPAGFGAGTHGGSAYMASKFKYVWDTNATHTFTGMETDWNAGTVPQSPAGSGSYYLHLQSFNAEGVAGGTLDYGPFVIDTTIPTGTIQINTTTPGYINSSTVNLTLSASDAAGVAKMRFSNDGATWTPGSWASAPAYGTSYTVWTLTGGDGAKTVYAQYQDNAGNVSTSTISTTITLDTGLPTGSLSVNGGAVYANTTPVALTIFATDSGSGVAGMQFSNDNLTWSGWEPYGTGKAWTLTTGDGAKVVYVQYNDAAGNVSTGTISDGIMLDPQYRQARS